MHSIALQKEADQAILDSCNKAVTYMTNIKTTFKQLSENEVEITCELDAKTLEAERPRAMSRIGEEVSLPGFRKGHVPENILTQKFGEAFILEEMANLALDKAYPEILKKHEVHALGMPKVEIKKLAKDNPFEFTLTFPVLPEIKLPDYKKIAKGIMSKEEDTLATEDEIKKAEESLLKQFATKDEEGKESVPELTLEIAQKFGPFQTIEEFKDKIKESITTEKTTRAREKKRLETMEGIIEGINAKLPQILIDSELERMMAIFRQDIERMGMNVADYLTAIKKTEADLRKEWVTDAEKRAKVQIALNKIASAEKLEVPHEELDAEVSAFTAQYKDIDRARATMHIELMLTNEKVFQFLENQK